MPRRPSLLQGDRIRGEVGYDPVLCTVIGRLENMRRTPWNPFGRVKRHSLSMSVVLLALAVPAAAQVQDSGQQKCIDTMSKSGAKVAVVQGKENLACVTDAGKGRLAGLTAQDCLSEDRKDKVSRKALQTLALDTDRCAAVTPSFGYAGGAAANTAAIDAELGLVEDLFGSDLDAAVIDCDVDKSGCKCQQTVLKITEKLASTKMKAYRRCQRSALREGRDPIPSGSTSAGDLEPCLDDALTEGSVAADGRGRIARVRIKLADLAARDCASVASPFPGNCAGLEGAALADCLDAQTNCRVCQSVNGMGALSTDCDLFDDSQDNESCATTAGAPLINDAIYNVVLGRPTDTSIAISIMNRLGSSGAGGLSFPDNISTAVGDMAYVEYGVAEDALVLTTAPVTSTDVDGDGADYFGLDVEDHDGSAADGNVDGDPIVIELAGLGANTQYFYRVQYSTDGGNNYAPGNVHTFYTQRASGSTFSFGVQGDTHPERFNSKMFNAELYNITVDLIKEKQPDLYFMLGDDFSNEKPIANFEDDFVGIFDAPMSLYRSDSDTDCTADNVTLQTDLDDGEGGTYDEYFAAGQCGNKDTIGCIDYYFAQCILGNGNDGTGSYPLPSTIFSSANSTIGANSGSTLDVESFVDGVGKNTKGYGSYKYQREYFLHDMANATSLFLVNGNHEQSHGAYVGTLFHNAAVWGARGRLKYYPLPEPTSAGAPDDDHFYTGDTLEFNGTNFGGSNGFNGFTEDLSNYGGKLRDYYAFEWGDALFVTIDPYWHSPYSPDTELLDDKAGAWDITMGDDQYAWLKATLEGSDAQWKFVFAHHINGGDGRGAAALVGNDEWGGGGDAVAFATNRPGWAKPIHQLFVDSGVTIFFQGHDHAYSREIVDGVVYQEVPNPADNSYWPYNCDAYAPASIDPLPQAGGVLSEYGDYDFADSVVLPDTGFLNVTVSGSDSVTVDYIRAYRESDLSLGNTVPAGQTTPFRGDEVNGETAFRYTINSGGIVTDGTLLGDNLADHKDDDFCDAAPPDEWIYDNTNNTAPY